MFRWHSISLALNCLRHAVTLEFCSMSIDRSRNASSRADTVSHVRHRVSLVSAPSNSSCTSVFCSRRWAVDGASEDGAAVEAREPIDADTTPVVSTHTQSK